MDFVYFPLIKLEESRFTKDFEGPYTNRNPQGCFGIQFLKFFNIVLIGWSTGNLDTWSYVQQFGKDKLRGVVTIDMSPLPLSPDPKWWTEGTIEELSGRHTGVDFF